MENISVYCDMAVNNFSEVHKLPGNQCVLVALGVVIEESSSLSSSLSCVVTTRLLCVTRCQYLKLF